MMNYNNLAQRTNYIGSSSAFKNIPFYLKTVVIPNITLSHPEVGGRGSFKGKLAADTLAYSPLAFELLVDEKLTIYQEIYDIITKNVGTNTGTFGDFSFDYLVEINDNKGYSVMKIYFEGCRVSSLGDLVLDSGDDDTEYVLSVDIDFDRFYIVKDRIINILPGVPLSNDKEYYVELSDIFNDSTTNLDLFEKLGHTFPEIRDGEIITTGFNQYDSVARIKLDVHKIHKFVTSMHQDVNASEDFLEIGFYTPDIKHLSIIADSGNNLGPSPKIHVNGIDKNTELVNDGSIKKFTLIYEPFFEPGALCPGATPRFAKFSVYHDGKLLISETHDIPENLYYYIRGKNETLAQGISKIKLGYDMLT